jgi:O-antigen/teichoic acid export membrane protein
VLTGLTERSLQALKWSYVGTAGRVVAQLVVQIVLARLLGPEAFGSFATVILVMALGSLIAEAGLSSALIHEKNVSDNTVRFTFTWLLIAGGLAAVLACVLARWLADLFENQELVLIVFAMSPSLLFQSMGSVSLALLRRNLQHRFVQFAQLLAYSVGFGVIGISCAVADFDVWSLVIAWNVQYALGTILLYAKTRHPIRPLLILNDYGLVRYGMNILGANIANWAAENLDNVVVAKMFGPRSIGLPGYNQLSPTNHLVVSLQQVLFPASAQASREGYDVGRAYLTVLSTVALVSLPVFVSIAVLSDTTILTLYGTNWVDAAGLLTPLALAMPFHAMMAIGGPVLWGIGRAGLEFKVQVWIACVFLLVLLVTSRYSAVAVAWGVLAVYVLRALWLTTLIAGSVGIRSGQLFSAVKGGLLLAAVNATTMTVFSGWLESYHIAAPLTLTACAAVALAIDCAIVIAFSKFLLTEDLQLLLNKAVSRFTVSGQARP